MLIEGRNKMGLLKWFSGGSDRSTEAVNLISDLLNELTIGSRNDSLVATLTEYKNELTKKESSIPFILSRMNISISNTIKNNKITLTQEQTNKLNQLRSLSNIRYGY